MQDQPPSHQESLHIISSMIETAKKQISDNGFHLLLWGWISIAGSLLHYGLAITEAVEHPHLAWLITVPGAIISFIYGYRKGQNTTRVVSYTDRMIVWVWITVFVSIAFVIVFMAKLNYQVVPLILLTAGNAAFITGRLIRFKTLMFGAFCIWIGAVVSLFFSPTEQLLVEAITLVAGYLVPGYALRRNYRKQ